MKAGELNERISFYKSVDVTGSYGRKKEWVKAFSCWARCRFKLGAEREIAGEIVNSTVNIFKIRHSYNSLVDETMQIHYDTRKYAIKSINYNKSEDSIIIDGESINE